MNGYLLDTNVVSEVVRPEPRVIRFLDGQPDLWLSAIVLHELHYGLHVLPLGVRRNQLSGALSTLVMEFEDRVLPVDRQLKTRPCSESEPGRQAGHLNWPTRWLRELQ